jgi:hypothetical protein
MANMCNNHVTCTGSAANITKFKKVLQDGIAYMQKHLQATSLGVDIEEGYFFDIYINDQEKPTELVFTYDTKWAPNLKDLANVAKKAKLHMVCEYCECGFDIYGKATIDRSGLYVDDEVPAEFIELIEYSDDDGWYTYDGIEYETIGDVIEEKYEEWKAKIN